ncbi:MAG: DNA-deoxyinosine glycosylase [Polaromonas sp.]|nr:DNA-deoxyinosine glycosylase [Polaromonas sp.]
MLTGLPPLVSPRTRLLILGSFPGLASLAAQQYYGHPQNQFWKILQAIWPSSPMPTGVDSYKNRSDWLLDKQLGVWDVYAACERDGSLDSEIRRPVLNDFAGLRQLCPQLEAIAHNGSESFKHAGRVCALLAEVPADVRRAGPPQASTAPSGGSVLHEVKSVGVKAFRAGPPQASTAPSGGSVLHEVKSVGVQFYKLPSTSPANASWSFERKLAAWREVLDKHGLP